MMNKSIFFASAISAMTLLHAPMGFTYDAHDVEYFAHEKTCHKCDFNSLNLSPAMLENDNYNQSSLTGTYLYGSTIEHLQLQQLNAKGIIGVGLTLHENDLTDADFSYSDLPYLKVTQFNYGNRPSFKGSTLDHSNFAFTSFEAPDLSSAAMRYASLYHVEWPNANLAETLLYGADLTFANLQGANLQKAILTAATTSHADFSNANLYQAEISADQLKRASSVCNATLPDGSIGECSAGSAE